MPKPEERYSKDVVFDLEPVTTITLDDKGQAWLKVKGVDEVFKLAKKEPK